MRITILSVAFMLAVNLAACGGGASGSGLSGMPVVHPSSAPTNAPTAAPSPGAQDAGDTRQAQIGGAAALVDAKTGLALYTFDGDTVANHSACTGGCLVIWPAHAAKAGESAIGNFTIFTRSDNGTLQWAYKGKPLYIFAQDTANNNGTGDNFQGFHIARP